jgi:hypothetical protein
MVPGNSPSWAANGQEVFLCREPSGANSVRRCGAREFQDGLGVNVSWVGLGRVGLRGRSWGCKEAWREERVHGGVGKGWAN